MRYGTLMISTSIMFVGGILLTCFAAGDVLRFVGELIAAFCGILWVIQMLFASAELSRQGPPPNS